MIGENNIYSVTDVNRYIKTIINNDENLRYIYVKGEISNFKYGASGHVYFSLKDKDALINCAMFATYASKLTFSPNDGDEVVVLASVDVYPTRGTYQLIVMSLEQVGLGEQLLKLEQLKKQLQKEGLFDVSRKREINIYPKKIGVISAKNSAAIKDIVYNINRRYPFCEIYFFPSQVQGQDAPKELCKAFVESQKYGLDTLIIGRGGGASEDLSAFNDEQFVRLAATSNCPIISAVGHEIDTTLIDLVADKRASTPTAAAELSTVDIREIEMSLDNSIQTMKTSIISHLSNMEEELNDIQNELTVSINDYIKTYEILLKSKQETLEAINPSNLLDKGYTYTTDESGKAITSVKQLSKNQTLLTHLKDGVITSEIKQIQEK